MFTRMTTTAVAIATLLSVCDGGFIDRSKPVGCRHEGRLYLPGTTISRGEDRANNHCYGAYCDQTSNIIRWDDWNCHPTTPPPTRPPTTAPHGCFYEGSWHPFGSMISSGEDRASNWCWSVHCSWDGHIMHGDDFNCFPSTPPTTGPPPP